MTNVVKFTPAAKTAGHKRVGHIGYNEDTVLDLLEHLCPRHALEFLACATAYVLAGIRTADRKRFRRDLASAIDEAIPVWDAGYYLAPKEQRVTNGTSTAHGEDGNCLPNRDGD